MLAKLRDLQKDKNHKIQTFQTQFFIFQSYSPRYFSNEVLLTYLRILTVTKYICTNYERYYYKLHENNSEPIRNMTTAITVVPQQSPKRSWL